MKHLQALTFAALLFGSFAIQADAAIPRSTEIELQGKAPEHLQVKIVKVKKIRKGHYYKVTATAKVFKVVKSGSGVVEGAEIKLAYTTTATPMPSAPPGLVVKGARYSAYLSKNADGSYRDAAASGTFEPFAEPAKE